jgi:anti-repressor protein
LEELIKVADRHIGENPVQTVDARELHAFLGIGKDFSSWIKARIEQYGFSDGHDFVTFESAPQNGGAGNRGLRIDYALTLDMAKELAMVERNERGKQARLYFIECERRAKALPRTDPMVALGDPAMLRGLLLGYSEKVLALEAANAALVPKAQALDRLSAADGSMCITDAAKALQMRPKDLFAWLSMHRWIFRRPGSTWLAYQERIQQGVLEHKVTTVERADGTTKVVEQVLVTAKGLSRLSELVTTSAAMSVPA